MKPIRALRADEIECRIGTVTKNGVTLLLYKDARCDMTILDEVFTPFGWERRHELINGKEFAQYQLRMTAVNGLASRIAERKAPPQRKREKALMHLNVPVFAGV